MKRTAKYISDLRKRSGLTQVEFASAVGASQKSVGKWERNISKPRPATLTRIKEFEKGPDRTKSAVDRSLGALPKKKPVPTQERKAAKPSELAKRIRTVRKQAGLSQAEFGVEVGVTQETISAWERGATPVPDKPRVARHLDRIASSTRARDELNIPAKKQKRRTASDFVDAELRAGNLEHGATVQKLIDAHVASRTVEVQHSSGQKLRFSAAELNEHLKNTAAVTAPRQLNDASVGIVVEISKEAVNQLVWSLADAHDVAPRHIRAALRRALNEPPAPLPEKPSTLFERLFNTAVDDTLQGRAPLGS